MNTRLSPDAQAVLNAYEESNNCYREEWGQLAAALRAIVHEYHRDPCGESMSFYILSIADELEVGQ